MTWLGSALVQVLLPPLCPLCRRREPAASSRPFCSPCWGRFERLREPRCPACGAPFFGAGPSHRCPRCLEDPPPFDGLRAWGLYRGGLLEALQRWKFGHDHCLRAGLEGMVAEVSAALGAEIRPASVVPVPCHRATLRRRGFDLPALLARRAARCLGIPWRANGLDKVRAIPELVGLDARERAAAVRGAYRPREALRGTVLLVDDVVTTTATARACARACREGGAEGVWVVALARTPLEVRPREASENGLSLAASPAVC